jgi:methylated-DNA-protein-cysteine methyltransferase-like protein
LIGQIMNTFFKQVYDIVEQIPYGKVISYGQIARLLGRPRAAREVGWAMRMCPEHLPWQRVVMADGAVTGGEYANMRRALLEAEGIDFLPDGRVDMSICNWIGDT